MQIFKSASMVLDLGSVLAGGGGCAWAGQSIKQQAATNCRASICFLTQASSNKRQAATIM